MSHSGDVGIFFAMAEENTGFSGLTNSYSSLAIATSSWSAVIASVSGLSSGVTTGSAATISSGNWSAAVIAINS